MGNIFSDRITDVPKSFIREILKVTSAKDIISFAGGLPNRKLFPVKDLRTSCMNVFDHDIEDALQYSTSEGDPALRQWISKRYLLTQSLEIPPENILITSGSQQALDILAKTLINEADNVVMEEPGYLGAIQSFSLYKPNFLTVPLHSEGMDITVFQKVMQENNVKVCYTVPNFQNPSGITYSEKVREQMAEILVNTKTILIEDNPYGDLRFKGKPLPSFYSLIPDSTVLLGSFSKTVVPAFRLGWIVAKESLMEKLIVAKQASDLHSNSFSQKILADYLEKNDLDKHIEIIRKTYGSQRDAMVNAIQKHFPASVHYTKPEGGMFLWITLPGKLSATELFYKAIKAKVAFVPGDPFYINKSNVNTFRLNYSCVDEETIEKGVSILGEILHEFIK